MNRLLAFLNRYRRTFLFFGLELLALSILVRYNRNGDHGAVFERTVVSLTGGFQGIRSQWTAYFSLEHENQHLWEQQRSLRIELDSTRALLARYRNQAPPEDKFYAPARYDSLPDSVQSLTRLPRPRFRYIPAQVIRNTWRGAYNYLMVDVGALDGIAPGQGVISATGVVGVVSQVTDHYALVMSLLNKRFDISAKILNREINGSLQWERLDPRFATLKYIPLHYNPSIGDTVVTSHLSAVYPEGLHIGTIEAIEESDENGFFDIRVRLFTDFNRLHYLYVLNHPLQNELDSLQSQIPPIITRD